jgi:hypothetical protein
MTENEKGATGAITEDLFKNNARGSDSSLTATPTEDNIKILLGYLTSVFHTYNYIANPL